MYGLKEERTYIELQRGGGYFSKFEYPDRSNEEEKELYPSFLEKLRTKREIHEQAIASVHGDNYKPFHNFPQQEARLKHQRQFWLKVDTPI